MAHIGEQPRFPGRRRLCFRNTCWCCCFPCLLLQGCAAFSLRWWCCFPSSALVGGGAFFLLSNAGTLFFLIALEKRQHHPTQKEEEGNAAPRGRERASSTTKEGAPHQGRMEMHHLPKQHHRTEGERENSTRIYLTLLEIGTKLTSCTLVTLFHFISRKRKRENGSTTPKGRRKAAPHKRRRRETQHHSQGRGMKTAHKYFACLLDSCLQTDRHSQNGGAALP